MSRPVERLLAEIVYSILFTKYAIILIVWYTVFDEIKFNISSKKRRKRLHNYLKQLLKFRVLIVFSLQIAVSLAKAHRMNKHYRYFSYLAYGILYANFL